MDYNILRMRFHLKKYLKLIIALTISSSAIGQSTEQMDSLYHELAFAKTDIEKANLLNRLSRLSVIRSREKSEEYAKEALRLSEKNSYHKGSAKAYDNIGHNYYYWEEDLAKASEFYYKALVIREDINDQVGIATTYNNLGNIKLLQGDYEKAEEYYIKNIEINKKHHSKESIYSYSNLAAIYVNKQKYRQALLLTDSSIEIQNKTDVDLAMSIDYTRKGNIYKRLQIDDSALLWYIKGLDLREKIQDSSGIVYIKNMIAELLIQKGEYDEAKSLINEILSFEDYFTSFYQQLFAQQSLSLIYKHSGDFKKAYETNQEIISLKDSIYRQENNRALAKIEIDYMLKKDRELRTLQQSKKNLQYTIIILALLVVLLLLFTLLYRHRIKTRSAILEKENMELQKVKLETKLELKQKEVITNIMKLAEKNEVINEVVQKLKIQSINFKKENQKVIKDIISSIESSASEDIWNRFENTFAKLHENFFLNLEKQHKGLTPNEKRLCAFLKLNLSSKEIASLTHLPTTSVETARVRLRKKLGLSNTKTSLTEYISNF